MQRWIVLLLLLLTTTGCTRMRFVIDAVPALDELTETTVLSDAPDRVFFAPSSKIALIDMTGMIADVPESSLLTRGENPVARFAESLRRAESDRAVKAVVVRINSPGGTVTASDVAYRELSHFRESTGKPVVVLMADVAASGGYYLACAGDEIIAHPTTITGSIGVIMQTINLSDGMRRIGIVADAITSGPNKALSNPFEPMPDAHREILQGVVNEMYAGFLGVVHERRTGIADADVAHVTDGRIVTGATAVGLGLVDATGDLRDAYAAAKRRAGVTSARLVKYHRPLEHVGSAYARSDAPATSNLLQVNVGAGAFAGRAGFYYLWDPTAWRR